MKNETVCSVKRMMEISVIGMKRAMKPIVFLDNLEKEKKKMKFSLEGISHTLKG